MDDIVKAAMAKWPQVPHCYGWLGLDARGDWYMRDDRCQSSGAFTSGLPGAKGSRLLHEGLIAFIQRNYLTDGMGLQVGQWYFQNGPQRVFVELETSPWIWRVGGDYALTSHTGRPAKLQTTWLDEAGYLYADTDLGFGRVHTQDMLVASEAVESGLWHPQACKSAGIETQFGYVKSPERQKRAGH